jgi:hypothetical protein|eukprot:COSAG03_NODE_2672_length_2535_cov_1.784072_2_plen_208_part_00
MLPTETCGGEVCSGLVRTSDERNDRPEESRRVCSLVVPLLLLRRAVVRKACAATEACSSTAAHASATCSSADSVTARTVASAFSSASAMRWSHSSVSCDSSAAAAALQHRVGLRYQQTREYLRWNCLWRSHRASRRAILSWCRSWARASSAAASASHSFSSSSIPVCNKRRVPFTTKRPNAVYLSPSDCEFKLSSTEGCTAYCCNSL